jgi:hypothetical protein
VSVSVSVSHKRERLSKHRTTKRRVKQTMQLASKIIWQRESARESESESKSKSERAIVCMCLDARGDHDDVQKTFQAPLRRTF